jgi:integrase
MLPDGTRKSLYARSQREVLEKRKAELERVGDGAPAGSDRQTVGDFLATWLEGKKISLRPSTWTRYEIFVRKDIAPELGRIKLAQLTPAHVQRLYARCLAAGKAPISVRHIHALLHNAFDDAAKWSMVARNVVALVDSPAAARREMQALDEHQVRRLLDAAAGDRLEALYVLAVTCGMREGELFGLRWKDVDLEKRALSVRQTCSWSTSRPTFGEPKTAKSRRRIELTSLAVAALTTHRKAQKLERIRNAAEWQDLDLVFTNEVGGALHPSNTTVRSFRPLLERAGLPLIRFHDLRHTAASIPLAHGVPTKIVSEMLGHASTSITDDIYAHVTPTMQRGVANILDAAYGGSR